MLSEKQEERRKKQEANKKEQEFVITYIPRIAHCMSICRKAPEVTGPIF